MGREVVILDELDTLQRRAVEVPRGPVLILGGPGSGKSTVLTGRAVSIAEGGSDRERMIFVTLDPLGPGHFLRTSCLMTGSTEPLTPFCFTPFTLANFILRNGGALVLGIPETYSLWDQRQARQMFAQAANPVRRNRRHLSTDAISQIYRWHRATMSQLASDVPDQVDGVSCERVWSDYRRLMEHSQCLDGDHVVAAAIAALLCSRELRDYWHFGRDGHVFIDDLHLATPAQYSLVALVGGPDASIAVTGDPHLPGGQHMLERFREGHPGVEVHRLQRAYRHTEPLTRLWAGFAACDLGLDSSLAGVEAHRAEGDAPVIAELGMDIPDIAEFIRQRSDLLVAQGLDYADIACDCDEASLAGDLRRELEARGIPCTMPGDYDGGRSDGLNRALGLMGWVVNPLDAAAFARAAFAGVAGQDDVSVSQVVGQIFDGVHSSGADPSQAALDMSRMFAPDDPVHEALTRVVEARKGMDVILHGPTVDFPGIVERAFRICGVDLAAPDPEIGWLMQVSGTFEGGDGRQVEENLARFLDATHPERSPAAAGPRDGMVIAAGPGATGGYRKAVFVIRLGFPASELHDDPAVYRAVTSATDKLFFVCGSSQLAVKVRELLNRSRRREPVEPPARPPVREEASAGLSEDEWPQPLAAPGGGEPGNPVTPGWAAKRPSAELNLYEMAGLSSGPPEPPRQRSPDPQVQPARGEVLDPGQRPAEQQGSPGERAAESRQARGMNRGDQVGPIIVMLILLLAAAVVLFALHTFGIVEINLDVEFHGFTALGRTTRGPALALPSQSPFRMSRPVWRVSSVMSTPEMPLRVQREGRPNHDAPYRLGSGGGDVHPVGRAGTTNTGRSSPPAAA